MSKPKSDLSKKNLETAIGMMDGFSHPVRLTIISALYREEHTVTELSELSNVSQSVASQHLAKLRQLGILDSRKELNKVYYYIKDAKAKELYKAVLKLFS